MSAVVLQYHHIGENTPRITSATVAEFQSHLDWLQKNNFEFLSLNQLAKRIKNKNLNENAKIVSITFDDTSKTICENAWPILKKYRVPFTIFINTSIMPTGQNSTSQCSWEQLEEIKKSGLLSIGNHTHTHPHMIKPQKRFSFEIPWWKQDTNAKEVTRAERIIMKKLGEQTTFFAYPYGEYNRKTERLLKKLGYIAFGQQSGAIGNNTNLQALPRFPMSGVYANLEKLPGKLLSLPFPVIKTEMSKNPYSMGKNTPAPVLVLELSKSFKYRVQCFLGNGESIPTKQIGNRIKAQAEIALSAGRMRYNCTAPSNQIGRFYWFSHQWVVSK